MAPTQTRSRSLPEKSSAEYLRKQAKDLARGEAIQLAAAQHRLAREYGYRNWSELIRYVKSLSAAYKAASKPDDATGAAFQPFAKARTDFEARFVAAALARTGGNMAEADLSLGVNLVDKPVLTEGPDLMQLRLHIVDESRDRPEMLELLEKLEIPRDGVGT